MGLFLTSVLVVVTCVVFLAAINKSIGVRRAYVKLLLKIFEYGRQNIESAKRKTRRRDECDVEDEDDISTEDSPSKENSDTKNDISKKRLPNGNGYIHDSNNKNGNSLISRDTLILLPDGDIKNHTKEVEKKEEKSNDTDEISFNLAKCLDYVKAGVEAIIEDEVTSRFEAEELKNWNLLTRTNRYYEFISWRLTVIWMCGFAIRYFFLMPLRVFICFIGVIWLTICTALVGSMPEGERKRKMVEFVLSHCFGVLSSAISAVISYHNVENRPVNGICVANHTSPIDALVLMCDNTYSLIGQRHGGFLGVLQRALARASPHIFFERAEAKDRHAVTERLRQHISDPKNPPILIFPEGTCINNTSVMQFKKGSFEVGGVIYPVAIKYDPRFGDAFWNSSRYSMMQYLYMMMTSWAIVCDVWYLPPMYREEGESAIDFANRVKSVIANQGGLVDLVWDGQLKRMKPKKEWKEKQQIEFTKRLKENPDNNITEGQVEILREAIAKTKEKLQKITTEHRDLHGTVSKVGKVIDRNFVSDFTATARTDALTDERNLKLLNKIIAQHYYRQGMDDVAQSLIKESGMSADMANEVYESSGSFAEVYKIWESIMEHDLRPALEWATKYSEELAAKNSSLEFKLHRLAFMQILSRGVCAQAEAIAYARSNFEKFVDRFEKEIQNLMGTLIYLPTGIQNSPYRHLISPEMWTEASYIFLRDACSTLGISKDSPLSVVVNAGCTALPALLNIKQVMISRQVLGIWNGRDELPIEIDLDPEHRYHSIFACPILRQQTSEDNPPMKLTCGHVISRDALNKLSNGPILKCPYCPMEQSPDDAKFIYF